MRLDHRPFLRAKALGLACCVAACAQAQPGASQRADELTAALSAARSAGCPGGAATQAGLRPAARLAEAAQRVARRESPVDATRKAGYRATRVFAASMSGYPSAQAVARAMAQKYCTALTDPSLTEIGLHQQGDSYWILLATPFVAPPSSAAAALAARVLALTNEARAQPRQCGERFFGASPALKPNPLLDKAAGAHALEMARHSFLEHEGRDGSTSADRVTRAGYRWRSVGENIASGQTTPEQVVREWVRSPTHCANLMSSSFTEMGLAYAVDTSSEAGIYWTQQLGRPR